VQILVVVASIQIRTLKTEVEKGFMRTVFGHELVGPKTQSNFVLKGSGVVLRDYINHLWSKGNLVNIPERAVGLSVVTQAYVGKPLRDQERVISSRLQ